MGVLWLKSLSRAARAHLGYAVGCAVAAVGVALQWGLGAGLIVGGSICALSCLLLVDVEEGKDE